MWIPRELGSELERLVETFPVVVLTGPRQVGKTSLLEHVFPDYGYVSLDVASNAEFADSRPEQFLEENPAPCIIDEIQYAPSLLRPLKVRVDSARTAGMYLLTGSQSFPLMASVSESLAGRAAVVPLLGLSAGEWFGSYSDSEEHDMRDFLWRGGFPGLWSDPENLPSRDRWYQGYTATYLERDVRNLLNVGRLRGFERFLRACAARVGQLLNMSELGRDVGVSPTTAREWTSVLQASGQVLLLEPYHRSLGKRLVKSPKLYFTDTGLAAYLLGIQGPPALDAWSGAGALWENHVVGQWLRWRDWHSPSVGLWFWQDRGANEVDLVVEANQKLYPIECKYKERVRPDDLKGIRRFKDFYGALEVGPGFVACTTASPHEVETGVTAISGWQVWELES